MSERWSGSNSSGMTSSLLLPVVRTPSGSPRHWCGSRSPANRDTFVFAP